MSSTAVTLLVTGFGPFPGVPFNASAALVQSLDDDPVIQTAGARINAAILPVEWGSAAAQCRALIEALKPDAILHFGVSSRATRFEVETLAHNATKPAADQCGRLPQGYYVKRGAPSTLAAAVPAARIVRRLRSAGIPGAVSRDAGRYLCNAVLYETLASTKALSPAPLAGFIHIPALTSYDDNAPWTSPACGWRELQSGARTIVQTLIEAAQERRRHARERDRFILNRSRSRSL